MSGTKVADCLCLVCQLIVPWCSVLQVIEAGTASDLEPGHRTMYWSSNCLGATLPAAMAMVGMPLAIVSRRCSWRISGGL